MNNAEKFKSIFGIYATELWSMQEEKFLEWLNAEALEKQEQDRWIPCEERLPQEYGEYRITWEVTFPTELHDMPTRTHAFIADCEYELTGEYVDGEPCGEWLLPDYIRQYIHVKVTAWKPLEEPYKAEET